MVTGMDVTPRPDWMICVQIRISARALRRHRRTGKRVCVLYNLRLLVVFNNSSAYKCYQGWTSVTIQLYPITKVLPNSVLCSMLHF